ncbi:MAG TPA: hypothetical protein VGP92_06735 [Acidimicrobiia bacterium]|nr:hypothetical protein [Acidimicrobiia bacterium]
MGWRRARIGLGCAIAALSFAACATPGYSPSRIETELVQAGATSEQAKCVTTGLTDKIDRTELSSHSAPLANVDPSKDEFAITRQILKKCRVNLPLLPR